MRPRLLHPAVRSLLLLGCASACAAPTWGPSSDVSVLASAAPLAYQVADEPAQVAPDAAQVEGEPVASESGGGFMHGVLMYLPNRIFDVFDIVRARVRLGPGLGIGVRATELADVYLGSYVTVWVGIHGPRRETKIPWPVGLESKSGAELSVADATVDGSMDPNYGLAEFGVDFQALIVGAAVGVDPFEVLDLVLGLLTIDLAEDDY